MFFNVVLIRERGTEGVKRAVQEGGGERKQTVEGGGEREAGCG